MQKQGMKLFKNRVVNAKNKAAMSRYHKLYQGHTYINNNKQTLMKTETNSFLANQSYKKT